jgi:3,4-dihydroxy 2-butanone 4-phosphate synthase / GTP cyclohydrolase II
VVHDHRHSAGGAVVVAAEHADASAITFMAVHARGLIALGLTPARCAALGLHPMTHATGGDGARSMVSIEARDGVSTGISAQDRARTIQVAVDPDSGPGDLVEPGHVFPIRTAPGGVLERPEHAEAAVDLARLAGKRPAAVVCTILGESGAVAVPTELERFCRRHALCLVDLDAVAAHRRRSERFIEVMGDERVATAAGPLRAVSFRDRGSGEMHVALCSGDVTRAANVLVEVHMGCLGGDVLGSPECGCGERLRERLHRVAAAPAGVLVYLGGRRRCGAWDADDAAPAVARQILSALGADPAGLSTARPAAAAAPGWSRGR